MVRPFSLEGEWKVAKLCEFRKFCAHKMHSTSFVNARHVRGSALVDACMTGYHENNLVYPAYRLATQNEMLQTQAGVCGSALAC
jgi:hypothetical protein